MKLITQKFVYGENTIKTCHASTLTFNDYGEIVLAWFGGSNEGQTDEQIYSSVYSGGEFIHPKMVSKIELVPHWNPVLYNNGRQILLYHKRGYLPNWETVILTSSDGGRTFDNGRLLDPNGELQRGPVKNKPLKVSNGLLLAPSSAEQGIWRCFIDISCDDGYTYQKGNFIPQDDGVMLIQPSLWEDGDGVHALMRSKNGKIFRADSHDFGMNFCKAYPIPVPNNDSGLDLVRTASGKIVLICNPIEEGRSKLQVLISDDNGASFSPDVVLEEEEYAEFSYPCVISRGNRIYGAYTYKRRLIRFFELEE